MEDGISLEEKEKTGLRFTTSLGAELGSGKRE